MTAVSIPGSPSDRRAFFHDLRILCERTLRGVTTPRSFSTMVVTPLAFFVAFHAVTNKLLANARIDAAQFLPPAIVVQAAMMGAITTAFFVTTDRRTGVLSRFQSMPISAGAVPCARLLADAVRAAVSVVVTVAAGHVAGFRFHSVGGALAFTALAVLFAVALSAGTATIGLRFDNPETVSSMLFLPYLPLLTLSTAFVPSNAFPGWLQPVVELSPVTVVIDALRSLANGGSAASDVVAASAWITVMLVAFGRSAQRAFRRPT